mmetsp:Transcript_9497/g.21218  ORF Transcript_9497/g.21218 Transcript_9497/m.21218 type:complete len:226 (-) Transcript_9497:225-902(-)
MKLISVTAPRCPRRRNRPVSATISQITTAPSEPPEASRVAAAAAEHLSNTTQRTGLDPCPFKTSGSRVTNSSAPAPPSSSCSSEWTRPRLDVATDPDDEDDAASAAAATSEEDTSKTRTVPSDQPVATLQSPPPLVSQNTSMHVTSSPFRARPDPTPPLGLSRWAILTHGLRLRKLNPITCDEALERRGDDGEEPKKASVDVVGGAVDDAVDVVREKASAHSYRR